MKIVIILLFSILQHKVTPVGMKQATSCVESENLPSEKLLSRQKLQMKKRLCLERFHDPPPLSPLNVRKKDTLKSQFKPPSTL